MTRLETGDHGQIPPRAGLKAAREVVRTDRIPQEADNNDSSLWAVAGGNETLSKAEQAVDHGEAPQEAGTRISSCGRTLAGAGEVKALSEAKLTTHPQTKTGSGCAAMPSSSTHLETGARIRGAALPSAATRLIRAAGSVKLGGGLRKRRPGG